MAIVIKEIHVKAKVEKDTASPSISEKTITQLKQEIIKEIQDENSRITNWEKER